MYKSIYIFLKIELISINIYKFTQKLDWSVVNLFRSIKEIGKRLRSTTITLKGRPKILERRER